MGNGTVTRALLTVITVASGMTGLETIRSLFKQPVKKSGAVVFDKYTNEGERNVGTGDAGMFLVETGDQGEDEKKSVDTTEEDGGGNDLQPMRKKKRKTKGEK